MLGAGVLVECDASNTVVVLTGVEGRYEYGALGSEQPGAGVAVGVLIARTRVSGLRW